MDNRGNLCLVQVTHLCQGSRKVACWEATVDRIYPHGTWVHQNTTSSNRRAVRSESGMLSARKGENLRRNEMLGKKLPVIGGSQCLYFNFQ